MLPTSALLFNVFMNVALYIVFTLICFYFARPPTVIERAINSHFSESKLGSRLPKAVQNAITVKKMTEGQTVAICFCGAAKTTSLGIPLVSAMWFQADSLTKAYVQIPVLLYTIEQVWNSPSHGCHSTDWLGIHGTNTCLLLQVVPCQGPAGAGPRPF
jgi:solute carrier family 10 (sodium/bile acid cotransporter), member 7